jgi:AcrR family transcriptional regulator
MSDKERIFNRVLGLYSRYGIKSITMDDICRELGISKKTLYQLVKDKQDLIDRVIAYEMDLYRKTTDSMKLKGLNAIEELIHVNHRIHTSHTIHSPTFYYDLKKYYPDIHAKMVEHKRKRMYELTRHNLEKGIREGLYREDLNPHMIARLYMARVEMMSNHELIEEEESESLEFIREIFVYHLHGILNEDGRKFIENQKEKLFIKN